MCVRKVSIQHRQIVGRSTHVFVCFRLYSPGIQVFDGENQVPVLAPHDVAVVDGEAAALGFAAWLEELVAEITSDGSVDQ